MGGQELEIFNMNKKIKKVAVLVFMRISFQKMIYVSIVDPTRKELLTECD